MSACVTEARRAPRLHTFKGGVITFGVAPPANCLIRNMSGIGAALEIDGQNIPDNFTLVIKPEFVKRKCRVVWRSAKHIGVQFE
jgi:hypothetical protein